jgi:hypothetical protein
MSVVRRLRIMTEVNEKVAINLYKVGLLISILKWIFLQHWTCKICRENLTQATCSKCFMMIGICGYGKREKKSAHAPDMTSDVKLDFETLEHVILFNFFHGSTVIEKEK